MPKEVFAGVLHRSQWGNGDPFRYTLRHAGSRGEAREVGATRPQLDPVVNKIAARAKAVKNGKEKNGGRKKPAAKPPPPTEDPVDWGHLLDQEKNESSRDHMRAKAVEAKAKATEFSERHRAQQMATYQKKVSKERKEQANDQAMRAAEEAQAREAEAEETAKERQEEAHLAGLDEATERCSQESANRRHFPHPALPFRRLCGSQQSRGLHSHRRGIPPRAARAAMGLAVCSGRR